MFYQCFIKVLANINLIENDLVNSMIVWIDETNNILLTRAYLFHDAYWTNKIIFNQIVVD